MLEIPESVSAGHVAPGVVETVFLNIWHMGLLYLEVSACTHIILR